MKKAILVYRLPKPHHAHVVFQYLGNFSALHLRYEQEDGIGANVDASSQGHLEVEFLAQLISRVFEFVLVRLAILVFHPERLAESL